MPTGIDVRPAPVSLRLDRLRQEAPGLRFEAETTSEQMEIGIEFVVAVPDCGKARYLKPRESARKGTEGDPGFDEFVPVCLERGVPATVIEPDIDAAIRARRRTHPSASGCIQRFAQQGRKGEPVIGGAEDVVLIEKHRFLCPVVVDVLLKVDPGAVHHADIQRWVFERAEVLE